MDTAAVLVQAAQFGYRRYGPKGAVAAGVAVGASYVAITRVVPVVTGLNEQQVEELYEQVSDEGVSRTLGRGVEAYLSSRRSRA